jgi:hypothetical protein
MGEEWSTDRARLRCALREHPGWSGARLAQELGRSRSWVKKWRRRLAAAPPDDEAVLRSRSRARTRPPPTMARLAVERVLAIRDDPPAGLRRVPGPRAILYVPQQDAELQAAGVAPPRSTATVWRVLAEHGRIARRPPIAHEPLERPPPLTSRQLDFKDVGSVPADPDGATGERAHAVEALNCVDCGTSLLVSARVRDDVTEETTLAAVAELLREHGLPAEVTVDRDPRFVGAAQAGEFPSPFVRFPTCLGVTVHVNPPNRPDLNGFVMGATQWTSSASPARATSACPGRAGRGHPPSSSARRTLLVPATRRGRRGRMARQQRRWVVERRFSPAADGWARWDRAYQLLLAPSGERAPDRGQEDAHERRAGRVVRPGLDGGPGPGRDHRPAA